MYKLVLIRHGESTWNLENRFTGWTDVDLTPTGVSQAMSAGKLLKAEGYEFDLAYTSVLKRAIHTLWYTLDEMDRTWLPVVKDWRLNERHYGALQGLNKAETWPSNMATRRCWSGAAATTRRRPPWRPQTHAASAATGAMPAEPDRRAADRMPEGHRGPRAAVLERIHGSCHQGRQAGGGGRARQLHPGAGQVPGRHLRRRHRGLNIPNGIPLVYELDANLKPIRSYYLGDAEAAAKAAAAVASQGKA
jgi:2,3-bisphosphoglycerate-dependent phosphoglycerate mutase